MAVRIVGLDFGAFFGPVGSRKAQLGRPVVSELPSSGARKAGISDANTISGTPSGSSRSQFRLLGTKMRGLAGQVVRPEFQASGRHVPVSL